MSPLGFLLANLSRSLSEGARDALTRELEQRHRQEILQQQSRENIRAQLLNNALSLPKEAFDFLAPEERQAFSQALATIATPGAPIDSSTITQFTTILGKAAKAAQQAQTFRELLGKDTRQLGALLWAAGPEFAERWAEVVLGDRAQLAPLLQEGARYYEQSGMQNEFMRIQLKYADEKSRNEVRALAAQGALTEAQANALTQRLPLELQRLAQEVQEGKIKLEHLPQELRARIERTLADIGVSQAQREEILARIPLIQAQTEVAREQAENVRLSNEAQRKQNELAEELRKLKVADAVIETLVNPNAPITDPELIRAFLPESIDPETRERLTQRVVEANAFFAKDRALSLAAKELGVEEQRFKQAANYASILSNPALENNPRALKAAEDRVRSALPDNPGLAEAIIANAAFARQLSKANLPADIAKEITDNAAPPPKEQEAQVVATLRQQLEPALGRDGADAAIALLKANWDVARVAVDKDRAQAAYYAANASEANARAAAVPKQLEIDRERVRQTWEQIALTRKELRIRALSDALDTVGRLLAASGAAASGPTADALSAVKNLAQLAEQAQDAFRAAIANAVDAISPGCGQYIDSSGALTSVTSVATGVPQRCSMAYGEALKDEKVQALKANADAISQAALAHGAGFFASLETMASAGQAQGGAQPGAVSPFMTTYLNVLNAYLKELGLQPVDTRPLSQPSDGAGTGTTGGTGTGASAKTETDTGTGGTSLSGASTGGAARALKPPSPLAGAGAWRSVVLNNNLPEASQSPGGAIGLGYAAIVAGGEMSPSDTTIQVKSPDLKRMAQAMGCDKAPNALARAACEGLAVARSRGIANEPSRYNPAHIGVSHVFPAGMPKGKYDPNRTLADIVPDRKLAERFFQSNPALARFASQARGTQVQSASQLTMADVGAYYAYNFLAANQGIGVIPSDIEALPNESKLLISYIMAFTPPGKVSDPKAIEEATLAATKHLGLYGERFGDVVFDQNFAKTMAIKLSPYMKQFTLKAIGERLAEIKGARR